MGPIAAALGGIAVGYAVDWLVPQLALPVRWFGLFDEEDEQQDDKNQEDDISDESSVASESVQDGEGKSSKNAKQKKKGKKPAAKLRPRAMPAFQRLKHMYNTVSCHRHCHHRLTDRGDAVGAA